MNKYSHIHFIIHKLKWHLIRKHQIDKWLAQEWNQKCRFCQKPCNWCIGKTSRTNK